MKPSEIGRRRSRSSPGARSSTATSWSSCKMTGPDRRGSGDGEDDDEHVGSQGTRRAGAEAAARARRARRPSSATARFSRWRTHSGAGRTRSSRPTTPTWAPLAREEHGASLLDRLELDPPRLKSIAEALQELARAARPRR